MGAAVQANCTANVPSLNGTFEDLEMVKSRPDGE